MKKLFMVAMALIVACSVTMAQDTKELRKEREEIRKMAKSQLKEKVDKATKKEVKKMEKDGWKVKPGALPLEKQLQRSYEMQYEYDEDNFPKYIMGTASSIGENYDAARNAAMSLAAVDLAGQIQKEVTAITETTAGNKQLSAEDAASIVESLTTSKDVISQSIGRTIVVTECYRIAKNKNNEVLVRIAYNGNLAKKAAKEAIRQDLEKKGKDLHNQLDQLLGF